MSYSLNRRGFSLIEGMVVIVILVIVMVSTSQYMLNANRQAKSVNQVVENGMMLAFVDRYMKMTDSCKELGLIGPSGEAILKLPVDSLLCQYGGLGAGDCPAGLGSALCPAPSTTPIPGAPTNICEAPYPFRASPTASEIFPKLLAMRPDVASAGWDISPSKIVKMPQSNPSAQPAYILNLSMTGHRLVGGDLQPQNLGFILTLRGTGGTLGTDPNDIVGCSYLSSSGGGSMAMSPIEMCSYLGMNWADGKCSSAGGDDGGIGPIASATTDFTVVKLVDVTDFEVTKGIRELKQSQIVGCINAGRTLRCNHEQIPGDVGTCFYKITNGTTAQTAGLGRAKVGGKVTTPEAFIVNEGWVFRNSLHQIPCTTVIYAKDGVAPGTINIGEVEDGPSDEIIETADNTIPGETACVDECSEIQ